MLTFLIKRFVPDAAHVERPSVRLACGMMAAVLGIALKLVAPEVQAYRAWRDGAR